MNSWEQYLSEELPDDLPVDVYPNSNGEFFPGKPTREQHAIMALQNETIEITRRKFGMSRRAFVRTAAAYSIGVWAVSQVSGGKWGRYANAASNKACDLEFPGAQLANLPGEFIIDVQSHHLDSGGDWRVRNPRSHLIHAALWEQGGPLGGFSAGPGVGTRVAPNSNQIPVGMGEGSEADPIENLGRYHYFKELFLDSSTSMTVLSAVPADPSGQPLPIDEAALTVGMVNAFANNTPRSVMHAFVMPNRGSLGRNSSTQNVKPLFLKEELEMMERHLQKHPGYIRGWKVYTPYGDVSNSSGWFLDDPNIGLPFLEHVRYLGNKYNVPKTIAAHKGFALPGFDQTTAACRDVGIVAKQYRDIDFIIYHSGHSSGSVGQYAGDAVASSSGLGTDSLIKSLRENKWDASQFVKPGMEHGNVPNVWGELGSVWETASGDPNQASHLLGKLIQHVGPQRVVWGTDALWGGSPQSIIVRLRALEMTDAAKQLYNLPYGLDGDRFDPRRNTKDASHYLGHPADPTWPTDFVSHPERSIRNGIFGRNVAGPYRVDPDAMREKIKCDDVQKIRDAYIVNPLTPRMAAPLSTNEKGPLRTDEAVLKDLNSKPWSP